MPSANFDLGMTHFTIKDENGNIVAQCSTEDLQPRKVKVKPPLGVTPRKIFEMQRVRDLCRALYEYSQLENVDYDLLIKWSEELNDRLYELSEGLN